MQDLMNKYKELEFTLVTELTRLQDIAKELDLPDIRTTIDEEIKRVKEKNFRVIVVGEFKRGKSTLINALLKRKVLPADIIPTTATINRVVYDPNPFVKLYFKDGTEQDLDIGMLTNYVTKLTPEGEAIALKIKEAVIFYPTPFCQNNIFLIDTPGLCDDETMTEITISAIGTADAAIMVISALSPFSQTECDFVTRLVLDSESLCRLVFAVNYIDKLDEDDVDRLLEYAKKRIYSTVSSEAKERYGEDSKEFKRVMSILEDAPVYGISSYLAINARTSNDNVKLEKSRFQYFEQELENILATEQGLSAIRTPFEKMIFSCDKIVQKINSIISDSESKIKDSDPDAFLAAISWYEQNMKHIVENIKDSVQPMVQRISNLCTSFLVELYKNGLVCFEKIGIYDINFQMNNIDSYFRHINETINNFEKTVFNVNASKIHPDIIKAFNNYIFKLNENYKNTYEMARKNNIDVMDKLEMHDFFYWLDKHPFPEFNSGFMLPTDVSINNVVQERFSGFLTAYSFSINIGRYWGQLINPAVDMYKDQLIKTYQTLVNEITGEYMKNYESLVLQIRGGFFGQLGFAKEKQIAVKNDYEKKRQVVLDIKNRSYVMLEEIKKKNINFI